MAPVYQPSDLFQFGRGRTIGSNLDRCKSLLVFASLSEGGFVGQHSSLTPVLMFALGFFFFLQD